MLMAHDHRGFFEGLQALDDAAKTKILVVATVIIMLIVGYLWLGYFNNFVINSAEQPAVPNVVATDTAAVSGGASFWQQTRDGFGGIVHGIQDLWGAPRQYIVQPNP